jgi:predicted RNase H-like nuclease
MAHVQAKWVWGLDVGKKKWACVKLRVGDDGQIAEVLSEPLKFCPTPNLPDDCLLAVADVPMGLLDDDKAKVKPNGKTNGGRSVDYGAKKWCLHHGSVSPPPTKGQYQTGLAEHARAAAATVEAAKKRKHDSVKPPGLTTQAFEMIPAIESGMDLKRSYHDRVYESHPEIVFASLAGGKIPMGKKTLTGALARAMYLSKRLKMDCVRWIIEQEGQTKINADDWLDALAMAVVAFDWRVVANRRILNGADGVPQPWYGEANFLMALPDTPLQMPPAKLPPKQVTDMVLAGMKEMRGSGARRE